MIKVLHIVSGLQVGGAEMVLSKLIAASSKSEIQHTVISLTPEGGMQKRYKEANIDVIIFYFRGNEFRESLRLFKLIMHLRPHIVQTWMYHSDLIGGLISRLSGNARVIWGVRTTDVNIQQPWTTKTISRVCAWLSYFIPHAIVAAAEASRRSHVAAGYRASLFHVIPNGFDTSGLSIISANSQDIGFQFGFSNVHRIVGCIGRFHPAKDHRNFVQAAGLVAAKHADVRFLMVGRGLDSSNAELAGWLAQTGVADRFVLLGERSDVPLCLAAMDIFCLPSRTEGFPNVVGEAMAMGLPCVVTDVGDASFLLGDGGVVVPKEDSHALAAGLLRLLSMSDQERMDIGARGKARVESEFSMERTRERFEAVYRQVLTKERR
jgi:glycosyltransferase involved in cell wall biosynthesis